MLNLMSCSSDSSKQTDIQTTMQLLTRRLSIERKGKKGEEEYRAESPFVYSYLISVNKKERQTA